VNSQWANRAAATPLLALFANAKGRENFTEQVIRTKSTGNGPEPLMYHPQIFC
jgi:hypothetical protein